MRVALLSFNAQSSDAIGNQLAEKLAFFLDRGADVRVFVESEQRLHPTIRPYCRPLTSRETKGDNWRFLSSADIVVVEYGQYYALLELLPLLAGGKGRILVDYHGVTPPELWSLHNREAIETGIRQRGLVWTADAALAHSLFTCRELQTATGFPPDRIACLGHPLDRHHFCPAPPQRSLRDWLGVGEGTFLLFVGRLAPNKRVPVLIEAVARLRDLTPTVHAVVIGDDGDIYQAEARHCRTRAAELGVTDRLHLLGQVNEDQLRDAYRSADMLVVPSRHEGFCIPVVEAMACGLPVVAARNAALPETVAGAGLTFEPEDAEDLARQVRRVLSAGGEIVKKPPDVAASFQLAGPLGKLETCRHVRQGANRGEGTVRIAVVGFRYGTDFVGGAETSLRRIAEALHEDGHHVEVFTTCTLAESDWSNQVPERTTSVGGLPVHHYRLDAYNRDRHLEAVRAIVEAEGNVSAGIEQEYVEHSIHSARLLAVLRQRNAEFDIIITGPYLFGLTLDVARAFPDKTLLLPCFHDEPFARLTAWRHYERTTGILYHSAEEQLFAECQLGLNHPAAVCIGGLIDTVARPKTEKAKSFGSFAEPSENGDRTLEFRSPVPVFGRYVVYCGRYSAQKGLPVLLDYAERYAALHPDRFSFVFLGQGEVPIPKHAAFRDLGFVEETIKQDLLAGAAALVQLSRQESLSYAALEAWAQGTPVIADLRCDVLAGHLRRCGGGQTVGSFEEIAQALDDLWQHPEPWQARGRAGQEYVREHYGSRQRFSQKLMAAIRGTKVSLAEHMKKQGLKRAAQFDRSLWRERFGELVENLLDAAPRPYREQVDVKPRTRSRTVPAGCGSVFIPVRVVNRGTHALGAGGPGRTVLRYRLVDEKGIPWGNSGPQTQLPGLVMPGRAVAAAVQVVVPAVPGVYQVAFQAERLSTTGAPAVERSQAEPDKTGLRCAESRLTLTVEGHPAGDPARSCSSLLNEVQNALAEAYRRHHLPADYLDISEGWFATWKRRIKRKLLGNFKHAYVDVLSRQQTAFNQVVLTALEELAECCATLDHVRQAPTAALAAQVQELAQQLAESQERCASLEERLSRLENRIEEQESEVTDT